MSRGRLTDQNTVKTFSIRDETIKVKWTLALKVWLALLDFKCREALLRSRKERNSMNLKLKAEITVNSSKQDQVNMLMRASSINPCIKGVVA